MAVRELNDNEKNEIEKQKKNWESANASGDQEGKDRAHAAAEAVRARAGFSGGTEGSERREIERPRGESIPTPQSSGGGVGSSRRSSPSIDQDLQTVTQAQSRFADKIPETGKYEGQGYSYKDDYGFGHTVKDFETAKKYADGDIYNYQGVYGGGYAKDLDTNERVDLNLPGSRDYGNRAEDDSQRRIGNEGVRSEDQALPMHKQFQQNSIERDLGQKTLDTDLDDILKRHKERSDLAKLGR